jgi:hypothetical protein
MCNLRDQPQSSAVLPQQLCVLCVCVCVCVCARACARMHVQLQTPCTGVPCSHNNATLGFWHQNQRADNIVFPSRVT